MAAWARAHQQPPGRRGSSTGPVGRCGAVEGQPDAPCAPMLPRRTSPCPARWSRQRITQTQHRRRCASTMATRSVPSVGLQPCSPTAVAGGITWPQGCDGPIVQPPAEWQGRRPGADAGPGSDRGRRLCRLLLERQLQLRQVLLRLHQHQRAFVDDHRASAGLARHVDRLPARRPSPPAPRAPCRRPSPPTPGRRRWPRPADQSAGST